MLRIAPPPFRSSTGAKARMTPRVPKKCVSISCLIRAMSPSISLVPVLIPALLISRVTSGAARTAAAIDSWSVMSSANEMAPSTGDGVRALA